MNHRKIGAWTLTILGILCADAVFGQGNGLLPRPKEFHEFISPTRAQEFYSNGSGCDFDFASLNQGGGGAWVVYSVYHKTVVYDDSNANIPSGNVSWRTPLKVRKVQNGMLNVTFIPQPNSNLDEGWVSPCDVLLWDRPITRNGGFPQRKVVLTQLGSSQQQSGTISKSYKTGPCNRGREGGVVNGLDVLYVMKEEEICGENWLLLSSSSNSVELKGWLPESKLTSWDTRVAYWENNGAGKSEYGEMKIPLFISEKSRRNFASENDLNGIDKSDTLQAPKLRADQDTLNRILHLEASLEGGTKEEDDLDLFAIVTPGKTAKDVAEIKRRLSLLIQRVKTLNIHFVIDATASMNKNLAAIEKGLTQFYSTLGKSSLGGGEDLSITVGCSVYRDILDGDSLAYDLALEPTKITQVKEIQQLVRTLKETVEFTSTDADHSLEESVYSGALRAIQKAEFEQNATNLLVLIGDAGDNGIEVEGHLNSRNEVLDIIKEKGIDFYIVQSTNGYHPAFDKFIRDGFFWLDALDDANGDMEITEESDFQDWAFLETGRPKDSSVLHRTGLMAFNTNTGMVLTPQVLGDILAGRISEAYILAYNRAREMKTMIEKRIPIPGCEDCDYGQYSIRAYAQSRYYGKTEEKAFVPFIYLEHDVFYELQEEFSNLKGLNHQQLYDELEGFVRRYASRLLGLGQNHPSVGELTLERVWNEAFNVPFTYPFLAKVQIKDIRGLGDSGSSDIDSEIRAFQKACKRLSNTAKERYTYYSGLENVDNGGVVYWIPGDRFPGFKQ